MSEFPYGYDACPGCGERKRVVAKTCKPCRRAATLAKAKEENRYIMETGTGRREHRVIVEEMIGRPLRDGEVVHHRNGLRWDNRPENLELVESNVEHIRRFHSANVPDETLRRLILEGLTFVEIREKVGVDVSRRLTPLRRELGIEHRKLVPSGKLYPERRKADWDAIRDLYAQGLSVFEVSRRVGVHHSSARKALRKMGIAIRQSGWKWERVA